jgi:rare lipoprotein A
MRVFLLLLVLALPACSQFRLGAEAVKSTLTPGETLGDFKVGKPYQIQGEWYYPRESYSYDETGVASWYGPGFHGRKTANGEKFHQREMTAAHPTLQMPSFVRVTNLENGRSVIVRINDRGPYSRGRIIDVSERAAELLDFKKKGTALVRVTVLGDESRQVAEAARQGKRWHGSPQPDAVRVSAIDNAPLPTRAPEREDVERVPMENGQPIPVHIKNEKAYPDPVVTNLPIGTHAIYVQAGAFSVEENAQKLQQKLARLGRSQINSVTLNGTTYHRLRLGPLTSVAEADRLLGQTLGLGAEQARIVVE